MSANRGSKGRYPFPKIAGVRDTTRRVAASWNPKSILAGSSRASARNSIQTDPHQDQVLFVEDPEERPTLLTRLASEPPNPLANLESLLPVSDSFNDENGFISLCNDLLVLNAQEHTDPKARSISIPGSSVKVSPFQFYHAYHLLTQRGRDLNGGILADDAGTGKTHIFFTACLLRSLAFESARAVRLYWTGRGRKKVGRHAEHHLPEGANGRSCPSQKSGNIVCYCVPGSFTRILCDSTPSGVSAIYCAAETWPDILNLVQTSALSPSIYQLCLVHNNAPTRFTLPLQPLVKTLSRGVEPDLRTYSPASYIFITTLDNPRLRNVFSNGSLNAGFVVIDEAHQVLRRTDSLTFRMASEFSGNGADLWFVSATPFSGCTLSDWVAPIELIAPSRAAAMQGLVTDLETAKSSGDADHAQTFRDHFNAVFDEKLVIRHFGSSTFFGKSISDVQDIQPRVISRETPRQHRSTVQALANQVAVKDPRLNDSAQRGLLYLVSLFPAAAELILNDPITFDMAAIRDFIRQCKNRMRIEESQPLRRLADQIVGDSPKLEYILGELDRMGQDKRERERIETRSSSKFGAGEDLEMKKMVIITPTVVSAVFLYLALVRHRKDVVLIHNWVSSQEKEQAINNFMSLSAAKLVKHNRILIAPFSVAGTGVNLQVASYQILTSPLPDKASQLQAFARTNRSGQRLRPLSHKILVLEDSPVDQIVLASHATLEIASDPFQINEPLRIAGNIPLGYVVNPTAVVEDNSSSAHLSTLGVNEALLLQNALSFYPEPSTDSDGQATNETRRASGSGPSTMNTEDGLLLQTALTFFPGTTNDDDGQATDERRGSRSGPSTMNTEDGLLLQTALTFFPGTANDDDSRRSGSPIAEGQSGFYSLFNNLSGTVITDRQNEPVSPMSTGSFIGQDEPVSPMSTGPFQDFRTSTPEPTVRESGWNLTYTPAPRHPLISGVRDVGHRPLPPLPTHDESPGQNLGPRRPWSSLQPPLDISPPTHIDAGPSLSSRRALELRLPSDFSPTFGNITEVVDTYRGPNGLSQRWDVRSPIERVPIPFPGREPPEYRDFDPASDRNLQNRLLELQHIGDAGEIRRQPGRQFHDW